MEDETDGTYSKYGLNQKYVQNSELFWMPACILYENEVCRG